MAKTEPSTILLVDDEAVIALGERRILEKYGYRVLVAHSGEAADELFAAEPGIDLILMDIDLGSGIDGTEAAQRILARRRVPLIFLSSHTEREVVERTEGISSYGYIVKLSGETVLIASIRMAFRLHAARAAELAKEAALRDSEAKYRGLVETTGTGFVIIDAEGRVADCNDEYLRLTGRGGREEVVGRSVLEWTSPADAERNAAAVAECAATGRVRNLVVDYVWPTGELVPVEINATMIAESGRSRILSLCRDIADRRRTEAALLASERKFRLLFEHSTDAVTLLDASGRVLFNSPSYYRITGFPEDARVGRNTFELVHPDDAGRVRTLFGRLLAAGGQVAIEPIRVKNAAGEWYRVEGYAKNLLAEPGLNAIVVNFRRIADPA
jgi:PAS domain S-box-containing protein